jgi:hypothetical protein
MSSMMVRQAAGCPAMLQRVSFNHTALEPLVSMLPRFLVSLKVSKVTPAAASGIPHSASQASSLARVSALNG